MLPTDLEENFSFSLLPALSLFPFRGFSSPISMLHTTPSHEVNQLMLQSRTYQHDFALSILRVILQIKILFKSSLGGFFCVPD